MENQETHISDVKLSKTESDAETKTLQHATNGFKNRIKLFIAAFINLFSYNIFVFLLLNK